MSCAQSCDVVVNKLENWELWSVNVITYQNVGQSLKKLTVVFFFALITRIFFFLCAN